ncbi:hypothetical protein GCM10027203_68180 [Nonomuraea fastidiosa]
MIYGITVGVLAMLGVGGTAMTTFIIVGAIVVGGLWAIRGMLAGRG